MQRVGFILTALGVVAAPLAAQSECAGMATQAQTICNRAVDAYKTFQPLGGIAISGGNPELGTARGLGGTGHLFVSARVNVVKADIPNPDTTQGKISGGLPAPVVEGGVGLLRGVGGGLLSVDALVSATLLPANLDKLSVDSNATRIGGMALGVGYGVRVGVMNGFFPIPAVSVSVMRRSLPRVQLGDLSKGDNYQFDTDLKATNVRVAASLRFLVLDVAAGFGFDHYSSTGHIVVGSTFNCPGPACGRQTVTVAVTNNRQVLFADAGLNLMLLKLVGEIGYQTGKDQQLSTTYRDFDPTAGHVYGGLGVRFSF
jgi:hypothetical protein